MRVLQLQVIRSLWSRRAVRWTVALTLGALWWWAALRLALYPGSAGPVEGALTAGGWGLGLIPLHTVPEAAARTRRGREDDRAGGRMAGRDAGRDAGRVVGRHGGSGGRATRAWRLRRWGGGSGRW